jgi:hypothetical protein
MRNSNEEKEKEKIMAQEKDGNNKAKERKKEREKNDNLLCPARAHSHCTSLQLSVAECHHSVTILTCNSTQLGTADGGTVVKVLRYKSEGCWFDSRWCHWNFSLT